MAYSSLKRKTPLKRSGFKRKQPPLAMDAEQSSDRAGKASPSGGKGAKTARKTSKGSLETRLDIVFALYIRLRDAMDGGFTRCISCGRVLPFSQLQCGHFFSRSHLATRWDERNCNAECVRCNCFDGNHLEGYRESLVAKIGGEEYENLCALSRTERKWSDAELRELIRHYTAEARRLGRDKGIRVNV